MAEKPNLAEKAADPVAEQKVVPEKKAEEAKVLVARIKGCNLKIKQSKQRLRSCREKTCGREESRTESFQETSFC